MFFRSGRDGALVAAVILAGASFLAAQQSRLPGPRVLDPGGPLERDRLTGELQARPSDFPPKALSGAAVIRSHVTLVQVGCTVTAPDGTRVTGLTSADFSLFENSAEQTVALFDTATVPASIALVIDASPSIFRQLDRMREAAQSLAQALDPQDEVAVVVFADQTRLLLPFSRDRELLAAALDSRELTRVRNTSQSFIYQAIYLTATEVFQDRSGRKAMVLLTDGQDSGLGLTWDAASMHPQPGAASPLAFDDVARGLGSQGIDLYVVSTENRPRVMTEAWLAAHREQTLVRSATRGMGIPHYTLYLAELMRRTGGNLYFLRELGTLAEVYRRIALGLAAEYTLGYYPATQGPGWRSLRVELKPGAAPPGSVVRHRTAYYVPALREP